MSADITTLDVHAIIITKVNCFTYYLEEKSTIFFFWLATLKISAQSRTR